MLIRVATLVGGVSTLLLPASPVRAIPLVRYNLAIFETTDDGVSSFGTPAINDSGRVAVVVGLDAGGQQVRRYTAANNPTIIDSAAGGVSGKSFDSTVAVNNSDTVVFSGKSSSNHRALFASSGGLISTVVDSSASFLVDGVPINDITGILGEDWDLADNGDVVFSARLFSNRVGVYQRNVAGGPIVKHFEDQDVAAAYLSPAINSQGKVAVFAQIFEVIFVNPITSEEIRGLTREQIQSSFGTMMDTNGQFAIVVDDLRSMIDMNNANDVAFKAKLDSGIVGIFKSTNGESPIAVVDTAGPFKDLFAPSINSSGDVAFLATFDSGGGKGIFRGPNPVTDKIIAIGDVIGTRGGIVRTVADITGFGNDGFSKLGQVAFTVRDQLGTQYLIKGGLGLAIDIDPFHVLQLTTATDEASNVMQDFTLSSFSPTQLSFDYRRLTPDAEIVAYINDIEVGRVLTRGTQPMEEFATAVIPINPLALFGEFLPELLTLTLEIGGGPGMTVQLDNIDFADIVNGDFSTGDLTGWRFGGGAGAAMVTAGIDLVFVPEPATASLEVLSLIALGLAVSRRRSIRCVLGESVG